MSGIRCNFQHDALVLGVEADINYADFGGSDRNEFDFLGQIYESNLNWDANWFGTIRGRLGFAFDSFLLYGTGGLAYGEIDADGNEILNGGVINSGSVEETRWGWTVGAGAEYALSENWSIGAEYLYVDLGSVSFDYQGTSSANVDVEIDYKFSVARATVKFGF